MATGASAAITATNISTPASPLYALYYETEMTGSISVAGTATAADGDLVDLRCYAAAVSWILQIERAGQRRLVLARERFARADLESGVQAARRACRYESGLMLRASRVPCSTTRTTRSTSGAESCVTTTSSPRSAIGAFDYDSFGSCGVTDSYLHDPDTLDRSTIPFYCNQWVDENVPGDRDEPDDRRSQRLRGQQR